MIPNCESGQSCTKCSSLHVTEAGWFFKMGKKIKILQPLQCVLLWSVMYWLYHEIMVLTINLLLFYAEWNSESLLMFLISDLLQDIFKTTLVQSDYKDKNYLILFPSIFAPTRKVLPVLMAHGCFSSKIPPREFHLLSNKSLWKPRAAGMSNSSLPPKGYWKIVGDFPAD